ncbi:MAG: four-carbon acid sugar kinase family protein [Verrucomicrobiota bacterium]
MSDLILSYYGDDFTGSVDVMETLTMHGIKAVLFLEPPTKEVLEERFPDLEVVGVAGVSRSLDVEAMTKEVRPKFEALRELATPIFHYKMCSTFDSSPTIGNAGRTVELAMEIFDAKTAPLILGTPYLKRFVAFGNLFASLGNATYRIDRHPTMSKHPTTPMDEGDVRLHLAKQTELPVELIDTLDLRQEFEVAKKKFDGFANADGKRIVLFDTVVDAELPIIGRMLWEACREETLVAMGSSGVEYALASYFIEKGDRSKPALSEMSVGEKKQMVVMCGSATSVTKEQIEYAESVGYCSIRLDGPALMDPARADGIAEAVVVEAIVAYERGSSVVIFATKGPDDPAIAATKAAAEKFAVGAASVRLGKYQGKILKAVLDKTDSRRACVAGGDTSGYACKELGIFALETAMPIAPGSPLCRVSSENPDYDGMEIALKAGQAGEVAYFEQIRSGQK